MFAQLSRSPERKTPCSSESALPKLPNFFHSDDSILKTCPVPMTPTSVLFVHPIMAPQNPNVNVHGSVGYSLLPGRMCLQECTLTGLPAPHPCHVPWSQFAGQSDADEKVWVSMWHHWPSFKASSASFFLLSSICARAETNSTDEVAIWAPSICTEALNCSWWNMRAGAEFSNIS